MALENSNLDTIKNLKYIPVGLKNKNFSSEWLSRCENEFGYDKLHGYDTQRLYAYLAERYLSYWFKKYTNYKELPWALIEN